MARAIDRLSAKAVSSTTTPGLYLDGGGLYLRVGPTGSKSWIFRYRHDGKSTDMGLGPVRTVSLAEARRRAQRCRLRRLDGLDPLRERRQARQPATPHVTFAECAAQYIASHQAGWKSGGGSAEQWLSSLRSHALEHVGTLPVNQIDTAAIMRVLDPIWNAKTETASRVRQRIEAILGWAATRGHRESDNPARWRGHLENLLPAPSKVASVVPHAALPFDEIPAFLEALKGRQSVSARALEIIALTAVRLSEAVRATWSEIDWAERRWTIPATRIKTGIEHVVPLSPQAIAVLNRLAETRITTAISSSPAGRGPLRSTRTPRVAY
jgi:integrase